MRFVKPLLAVLLLSLFLLPQVEKSWHHHSYEDVSIEGAKTLHKLSEKCAICAFEFSVFDIFDLGYHFVSYAKTYFCLVEIHSAFVLNVIVSFSERGPPIL
jgi:GMP synthase-like glutamine amidotransferase